MLETIVLAATAIILVYQLCIPPIVGLADNGDFARIMGPLGLQYTSQEYDVIYWNYLTPEYTIGAPFWNSGYFSTETALVWVALQFAKLTSKLGVFDIRLLGVLHIVLLLLGELLLLVGTRRLGKTARLALSLFMLLVMTDVAYVAPFNSLFSQTASYLGLVFLVGTFALALSNREDVRYIYLYCAAVAFFLFSKPQESVTAPFLLGVALWMLLHEANRRARITAAALCVLVLLFAALYYVKTPRSLSRAAVYFAFFDELLANSPNPPEDLRAFELSPSLTACVNTNYYRRPAPCDGPEIEVEVYRHVGFGKIAMYYLSHPRRLASLARRGSRFAFVLRGGNLGNFEAPYGKKRLSRAFAVWSDAKARIGRWSFPTMVALLVANGLWGLVMILRGTSYEQKTAGIGIVALVVLAGLDFMIPLLAESGSDLIRHWYAFHIETDILVGADLVAIVSGLARPLSALFNKRLQTLPV